MVRLYGSSYERNLLGMCQSKQGTFFAPPPKKKNQKLDKPFRHLLLKW